MGGRAAWTFTDQALSSLTNAALSVLVARSVDAVAFGAFAVVLLTFSFVIGATRAVVSDPLVIRFSEAAPQPWRRASGAAAGAALLSGVGAGVLVAAAGLLIGGGVGATLVALAVVLPGLLLQDCWRFAFFAAGRPASAALNDLVWALLQLGAVATLIATGRADVVALVLAWGLAATVAAAVGCLQARTAPSLPRGVRWFVKHRDLSTRLGSDYAINMGAVNLAYYLTGAIAGLMALGALRAAQVLLGPLQLAFAAFTALLLPIMSGRVGAGRSVRPLAVGTAGLASAVAVAWLALLLLLPAPAGEALLGDSWAGARDVMLPLGLVLVAVAVATGATLAFKALQRPGVLVRVTLVQAPSILVLMVAGAMVGGAVGAAWGMAAAQTLGSVLVWTMLVRSTGSHAAAPGGPEADEVGPSGGRASAQR